MLTPTRWIYTPNGVNNGLRVFCFPPAGYGAWIYQDWQTSLDDIQILPIEYPGKNSRLAESPVEDLDQLAAEICHDLGSVFDQEPCVMFGHSMGAWIAYEVIRKLTKSGKRTPLKFYASGNRSPILYGKDFDTDELRLGNLPCAEFWTAFEKCLGQFTSLMSMLHRRYGLNENLQNERIRQFVYPSFKADYKMIEEYQLHGDAREVQLSCPIHALSGEQDQRVTLIGLDAWRLLAEAEFELQRFPGCDHDCIHQNNQSLLAFLKQDLILLNDATSFAK